MHTPAWLLGLGWGVGSWGKDPPSVCCGLRKSPLLLEEITPPLCIFLMHSPEGLAGSGLGVHLVVN